MRFVRAVLTCLWKCVDFRGRARRSEFWCYSAFWTLSVAVAVHQLGAQCSAAMKTGNYAALLGPYASVMVVPVLLLVPFVSVAVRRLHDIDVSGWWLVSGAVPIPVVDLFVVGAQVFCFARPGTEGENRYGPDPRQPRRAGMQRDLRFAVQEC